jgi:alkanesulfonate monooxygenase SsuD/methylene tetrahydromethanopterin reductase-like flavin-dependent oxidoreductase (luciferase family)
VQAVPDELVDQVALVGDKSRIIERLQAWKEAGLEKHVGTMLINSHQPEAIELIANELL